MTEADEQCGIEYSYVQGGLTASSEEGQGIFVDDEGEGLQVWVDPALSGRSALLTLILAEGARISSDHTDPDTRLIILHPSSVRIFDQYCHPAWLPARQRAWYKRWKKNTGGGEDEEEQWQRRVILTETWPRLCAEAGCFLGVAEDWGGCRKGGPPVNIAKQVASLAEPPYHAVASKANLDFSLPPPPVAEVVLAQPPIDVPPSTEPFVEFTSVERIPADNLAQDGDEGLSTEVTPDTSHDLPMDVETNMDIEEEDFPRGAAGEVTDGPDERPSRPRRSAESQVETDRWEATEAGGAMDERAPTLAVDNHSDLDGGRDDSSGGEMSSGDPVSDSGRDSTPEVNLERDQLSARRARRLRHSSLGTAESPAEDLAEESPEKKRKRIPPKFTPLKITPMTYTSPKKARPEYVATNPEISAERRRLESTAVTVPSDGHALALQPAEVPQTLGPIRASPEPATPSLSTRGRPLTRQPGETPTLLQASGWQTLSNPPKILSGLRFYVQSGRFGRKATVANIILSGGVTVKHPAQATHALFSPIEAASDGLEHAVSEFRHVIRKASNTWCLPFDWLEASWDVSRLLPESDFAYEGSGSSTAPQSDGQAKTQDAWTETILDEALQGEGTMVEIAVRLFEQYGRFTFRQWQQLVADRLAKNPRPQPPPTAHKTARLSMTELEAILAKADTRRQTGETFAFVVRMLAKEHPEYSEKYWQTLYASWRSKTGKFAKSKQTAPTTTTQPIAGPGHPPVLPPTIPEPSQRPSVVQSFEPVSREERLWRDYDQYSALFQPYRQFLREGFSRDDIGQRLAAENPQYGITASTWNAYFGNWMRGHTIKSGKTMPQRPADASRPQATVEASSTEPQRISNVEALAAAFKERYNSATTPARVVAQALAPYTQLNVSTLAIYYNEWRRGAGRFARLPLAIRYTGPTFQTQNAGPPPTLPAPAPEPAPTTTAKPLSSQSNPSLKHSDSGTKMSQGSSTSTPNKRPKNLYTDSEEARMAVYITRRLPEATKATAADWADFAKENPARTHAAWVEHYRQYRCRINDLVTKLGGQIPGKRTPASAARRGQRDGSSDSIEFVSVQDKRSKSTENMEIVEVLDSDDEDDDDE